MESKIKQKRSAHGMRESSYDGESKATSCLTFGENDGSIDLQGQVEDAFNNMKDMLKQQILVIEV
jgi:hypothetical protein